MPQDGTHGLLPVGPVECWTPTMHLRTLKRERYSNGTLVMWEFVLQQMFRDEMSTKTEWRDVPTVEEES